MQALIDEGRCEVRRRVTPLQGGVSRVYLDPLACVVHGWSAGAFPRGITAEVLTKAHLSVQRNPIIAEVFHRTGLIERWGRGTNRVVRMCKDWGLAPPTFAEITGAAVVTFHVQVGVGDRASTPQATAQVTAQVTPQVVRMLSVSQAGEVTRELLQDASGIKDRKHFRAACLDPIVEVGWLERTIADKPKSPHQKYRLTDAGRSVLEQERNRG